MPDLKHSIPILALCAALLVDTAPAVPPAPTFRTLRFSRFTWQVIHSEGLRGPGPNVFDARNVYLDEQGRLVLETAFRDGRWTSAHVFLTRSLGYGSYELVLAPQSKPLDPLAVFGFFTWDDDPAFANREIDIELARWGHSIVPNLNFTVQPGEAYPERHQAGEFDVSGRTTLRFEWRADLVSFTAESGGKALRWDFPTEGLGTKAPFVVPPRGRERLGINLWLFQGRFPESADRIIIESFRFTRRP